MANTKPNKKALKDQIEPQFTTALTEAVKNAPVMLPIWVELPRSGTRCKWTSLSRSSLNALILGPNPRVKSISVRKRHAVRGKRLIHLQSLLDYLAGLEAAQSNQLKKGGEQNG